MQKGNPDFYPVSYVSTLCAGFFGRTGCQRLLTLRNNEINPLYGSERGILICSTLYPHDR